MPKIEFEYRDFWEVPRLIVCTIDGVQLLLDSEFDESTDEYASEYKVYIMPPELPPEAASSWADPSLPQPKYLGSIPVSTLELDPTKRKELEAEPLRKLLKELPITQDEDETQR